MARGEIHDEHPFKTPSELRDPVRRFRGRLAAPVTVVTAGGPAGRTGLTVSSLLVAEGEPSFIHLLIGATTDLWYAIEESNAFIVHVLEREHRELSDRFAGLRPSPGGLFAGLDVRDTPYGPELTGIGSRAYCRYAGHRPGDHHALVHGVVEQLLLHDLRRPLQYFRGEYYPR
jgi:flavin reductase (DIM6/NTAB) family NADH-FMN oxidoreductase RutF